jgi:putative membrane protein insertion efficiency factor
MCASASHADPPEGPAERAEKTALARPTSLKGLLAWPLLALIWFYRRFITPFTPPTCRFYPTCSAYGLEAIQLHGPFKGTALTVWRILRCQPFSPGGFDPVPGSELDRQRHAAS